MKVYQKNIKKFISYFTHSIEKWYDFIPSSTILAMSSSTYSWTFAVIVGGTHRLRLPRIGPSEPLLFN